MVVDNVDDESIFNTTQQDRQRAVSDSSRSGLTLVSLLPQSQNGSILITSRNTDVAMKLVGRDKDII